MEKEEILSTKFRAGDTVSIKSGAYWGVVKTIYRLNAYMAYIVEWEGGAITLEWESVLKKKGDM